MNAKTQSNQDRQLELLAKETLVSLNNKTMPELRVLAQNTGLRGVSKLAKPELAQKLYDYSNGYRTALQAQANMIVADMLYDLKTTPDWLASQFKRNTEPRKLAETIVKSWELNDYSETTLVKNKPQELRASLAVLASKELESIEWGQAVFSEVRNLLKPISAKVNADYATKVESIGTPDTQLKLSGKYIIDWCERVLMDYVNSPNPDKNWQKASLALALTSGRRMDEIHGDSCHFELAENNCIESIGLSKKKDETELTSPCLISNDLWLKAWNYLPEKRKGLTNAKVNSVISRNFSESLKVSVYPILGIRVYKDSRDFYAAYCLANIWKKEDGSQIGFLKKVLGHDSKKVSLSYEKIQLID